MFLIKNFNLASQNYYKMFHTFSFSHVVFPFLRVLGLLAQWHALDICGEVMTVKSCQLLVCVKFLRYLTETDST